MRGDRGMARHRAAAYGDLVKRNVETQTGMTLESVPTITGLFRIAALHCYDGADLLPTQADAGELERLATQRRAASQAPA